MTDDLRQRVAGLVSAATAGAVTAEQALAGGTSLFDLGLDSLGWLRLIDALEHAYDVELDLGGVDLHQLGVDGIAGLVLARVSS